MALTKEQRDSLIQHITTNDNAAFEEGDEDKLEALTDNQLVALARPEELDELVSNKKKLPEALKKKMKGKVDDDEEEEEPAGNEEKPKGNLQDWLKTLPAEARHLVQNSLRREAGQRQELITKITSNKASQFTAEELGGFDTEVLEKIHKSMGQVETPAANSQPKDPWAGLAGFDYSGAGIGGGGQQRTPTSNEDDPPLMAPVMNFEASDQG